MEKYIDPDTASKQSDILGKGKASFFVALLRRRKSIQILNEPFFLGTMTMGEAQGLVLSLIVPLFNSFSIASLSLPSKAAGVLRGTCLIGLCK